MRFACMFLCGAMMLSFNARGADRKPAPELAEIREILGQFEFNGASREVDGKPEPSRILTSCGEEIDGFWFLCTIEETVTVGPKATKLISKIFVGWEPSTKSFRGFQVDTRGEMLHYTLRKQSDSTATTYAFESMPLPGAKGKAETHVLKFILRKAGKPAFAIERSGGKSPVVVVEAEGKRT